jgi:hypothetical protein
MLIIVCSHQHPHWSIARSLPSYLVSVMMLIPTLEMLFPMPKGVHVHLNLYTFIYKLFIYCVLCYYYYFLTF